jgi:hypothetical protein
VGAVAPEQRRPVPRVPAGRVGSDSARYRRLDLYRCTTAAEVLDTIFQEAGAAAAETDDAYLAGLVRALDDLLHPMANLCSGGKPRPSAGQR